MATRFQFSIRVILAITTGIAACVGLWVADITWWVGAVVLATNLVLPPICWIVFLAANHARAFWLGVSFSMTIAAGAFFIHLHFMSHGATVAGINFLGVMDFLRVSAAMRHPTLLNWLFAPLVGFLCVAFHSLLQRGQKSRAE